MRISEVQRKDIAKLHDGMRDKPYQANRTLRPESLAAAKAPR